MKHVDFEKLVDEMWEECKTVMFQTKGSDYASSDDRLANFNDQAKMFGMTPAQVWLIYAGKHYDAIVRAIKADPHAPTKKGEPLSENFKDLIVYSFLGHAIIKESEKTPAGMRRKRMNKNSANMNSNFKKIKKSIKFKEAK